MTQFASHWNGIKKANERKAQVEFIHGGVLVSVNERVVLWLNIVSSSREPVEFILFILIYFFALLFAE